MTPIYVFPCEHCKIFKNTYFIKHPRTAASNSCYILHKKLNKIVQEAGWPFVWIWNIKSLYYTYSLIHFHSFYDSLSFVVIFCYSLSFIVTHCHSLSFVVTQFTTHCNSLYHSLSYLVIRCHSLSFVVTRCTTRYHSLYHSLSLVVPLVYLLINDRCRTCCQKLEHFIKRIWF